MPDLSPDLAAFVRGFRWTPDGSLDSWRVLRRPPFEGDCDDFAITALWIEAGSSLKAWWLICTFQAVFWYCGDDRDDEPHVALWMRGRGWIDNIHPEWRGETTHHKRWPWLPPFVAIKMLFGKVFG